MRLDQYIAETTDFSRAEAKKILRDKRITINHEIEKSASYQVAENDIVMLDDEIIAYTGLRYFMLNKPVDYVCSHEDDGYMSVLHLIDEPKRFKLHIAGRLDADTTGLLLITDDGKWSHTLAHSKKQCDKCYRMVLEEALTPQMQKQLEQGVLLRNETQPTLPAKVRKIEDRVIEMTIQEGRYHQVKRMLAAVGNHVLELHRLSIGEIVLDEDLAEGEYRHLSETEIASVLAK